MQFSLHRVWKATVIPLLFSAAAFSAPDFETEVRPILERSCFACHGPEKQKSGYRLDVRDVAIGGGASGRPAIIPHNAAESPLFQFVTAGDPELRMPPAKSTQPPLTEAEVAVLRAWIDAGPAWPDALAGTVGEEKPHWSLQPLVSPPVPGQERNPIDSFVKAKLTEHGLAPSTEADRRTLIRRAYYDLTGLTPTPEEVADFVADPSVGAYENLVDQLLAFPQYGERWARHWLDTVHFADSHGYEHDLARDNAWRYRDYVIAAFNSDTPWPRFVREQLAADVFFPDRSDLTPALGFLGAGTFDLSTYSTAVDTFDYLDRDDLVTQTSATFLSTTANCARCHAHKFDPISQADYYALQAVFSGLIKGDVAYDAEPAVARERKRLGELVAAADRVDAGVLLSPENQAQVETWLAKRGLGPAWEPLELETFISTEGASQTREANGAIVAGGALPEKDTYLITAISHLTAVTALRLDALTHDTLPMKGPGRNTNGNFHLSEFEVRLFEPGAEAAREIKIARATADFDQAGWDITRAIDGKPDTAWGVDPQEGQPHHAVFELAEPITLTPGARLAITMKQVHGGGHLIGAYRLSATGEAAERAAALPANVEAALSVQPAERTEAQRCILAAHVVRLHAQDALAKLPEPARVYAASPRVEMPTGEPKITQKELPAPKVVHLLDRGDFDKPREEVPPGALSALTHLPARFVLQDPANEATRRAALAEWIAHPDNVLAWRSIVNRVWHYHFGRGLCDTPSDFGRMGGAPSHPELLDWLAVWFRDEARGSLKHLHRLIMTSEVYRQSSAQRDAAAAVDAENRLLWRQNRHRLDADAYRDFTLAVSGRLDLTPGGPGVRYFSESKGPQITPALNYEGFNWDAPGAGRRSIYRFVWRGIADPFMDALDFPDLGLLSPVRGFSSSSLQALTLFNNEFVLHHSNVLAARVLAESSTGVQPLDTVARLVQLLWLRNPTETETQEFHDYANAHGLPALCRVLLNSNEFLFVD